MRRKNIAQENGDDKNPGRQTKPLLFFFFFMITRRQREFFVISHQEEKTRSWRQHRDQLIQRSCWWNWFLPLLFIPFCSARSSWRSFCIARTRIGMPRPARGKKKKTREHFISIYTLRRQLLSDMEKSKVCRAAVLWRPEWKWHTFESPFFFLVVVDWITRLSLTWFAQ